MQIRIWFILQYRWTLGEVSAQETITKKRTIGSSALLTGVCNNTQLVGLYKGSKDISKLRNIAQGIAVDVQTAK